MYPSTKVIVFPGCNAVQALGVLSRYWNHIHPKTYGIDLISKTLAFE